jgi:hypothetical protein
MLICNATNKNKKQKQTEAIILKRNTYTNRQNMYALNEN